MGFDKEQQLQMKKKITSVGIFIQLFVEKRCPFSVIITDVIVFA